MDVKPVFIFSLPRSGSTLLQRILAAHPQISTHAEPWLLLPLAYSLRKTGIYAEYNHSNAVKGITAFTDSLPNQAYDYYFELGKMVRSLYSKLADNKSVYFLDKTPRYYLILPEIQEMFPDAKFIFLFRNPLQVYASSLEAWYRGRLFPYASQMDLFRGFRLLATGFREMKARSHRVNFEDLLNAPEKTIRKLLAYMNLDYDPACIRNFNSVRFGGILGDQLGTFQYSAINRGPLEKWKGTINTLIKKRYARQFLSFIGEDDLNTLGYSMAELKESLRELRVNKFGLADLLWLMLANLIRIGELFLFIRKFKQKKRDGFPVTLHR